MTTTVLMEMDDSVNDLSKFTRIKVVEIDLRFISMDSFQHVIITVVTSHLQRLDTQIK